MNYSKDTILFNPSQLLKKIDKNKKLETYFSLLKNENKKINLVSRETIKSQLPLLAAESLLPFEKIDLESFENYLDIGSGGGLPSIPIIFTRNIKHAILVERTKKKTTALKRMIKDLSLENDTINVMDKTFEECDFNILFDLITLKLVKLTDPLLNKIFPLLKTGGLFIYYSGNLNINNKDKLNIVTCHYKNSDSNLIKAFSIISK